MTDAEKKRAYNQAYYAARKAEIIAQHREYRSTPAGRQARRNEKASRKRRHPEKVRAEWVAHEKSESRKQYRLRTRERQLSTRKEYYAKHRDRLLANHDKWYAVHRHEVLAKRRADPTNTEKNRQWRKNNPTAAALNHNRKWHKRRALKKGAVVSSDPKAVAARIKEIRQADDLPCQWCGTITAKGRRHVDHIIPLNKGGPHTAENLCCACPRCNCSKSDKMPHEFRPCRYSGEGTAVS